MAEGSNRFRFEKFDCGPGLRLAAAERISALQFKQFDDRMARIEELMERLDRRLWLAVFGVVAVFLTDAARNLIAANI